MIKLFDTFAGIGATHKALERVGLNIELAGYSEINTFADISYRNIHGADKSINYGDITSIEANNLPDFDMMNFSFPCKDFSVAGKMKGLNDSKGVTHSGLYYHGMRIIKAKKPKYVLVENVKGITFKRFENDLADIMQDFEDAGYNVYHKVLNASHFGSAQNRERFIMIGIRKDIDKGFEFPSPTNREARIKDILEKQVDEKYYKDDVFIKQKSTKTKGLITHKACVMVRVRKYEVDIKKLQTVLRSAKVEKGYTMGQLSEMTGQPRTLVEHWFRTDRSFSIPSEDIWLELKEVLGIETTEFDESIMIFEVREGVFDKSKRVYDINGIAPTLTATSPNEKILLEDGRIRELTPLECWRLMGYSDSDFFKAKAGIKKEFPNISDGRLEAELYERAGRSIPVNMLQEVFKQLF